jgi:hypothetical protein
MKKVTLLFIVLLSFGSVFAQDCSNIFFSQYIDGPDQDNALELYNPTSSPIHLLGYTINRYSNGSTSPVETFALPDSVIVPYGTFVIVNGQVDSEYVTTAGTPYWSVPVTDSMKNQADLLADSTYPGVFYFNGNVALTIENGSNIIDIFGKIGQDPGNAWTDNANAVPPYTGPNGGSGKWLTKKIGLIRKATVKHGVTTNPSYFFALEQWDTIAYKDYSQLHNHTCDCKTVGINDVKVNNQVVVYPNPVNNGAFEIIATENITDIVVYDLAGREMARETFENGTRSATINVNKLAPGTYLASTKLQSGNVAVKKLIIQ